MLSITALLVVIIAGFFIMGILIVKNTSRLTQAAKPDQTIIEWLKTNQALFQQTNRDISDAFIKSNRLISERLDRATQLIGDLQKEAGQFSEIGRSMRDLQEYLRSPKLRGNIGEEVLNDLISQMFPKNSFFLQYSFKSGDKVDAALKTDGGLLPIDSKFPLENFDRLIKANNKDEQERARSSFIGDVKKYIKTISEKYILPDEGTMDFALMYVPSEPVYYELVNLPEITNYAKKLRVYPVSPTTLYAHLQMILLSFEGKKMESRSKEVFRLIRAIGKDYEKTSGAMAILGKHLQNAFNQMSNVSNSFGLLGQKLSSVRELGDGDNSDEEKLVFDGSKEKL